MLKRRKSMQTSENFYKEIKKLQEKIRMKTGQNPSFNDLTDDFVKNDLFTELEKKLLKTNQINMEFQIRFDKRK